MSTVLRRVRGMFGMGLIWAAGMAGVGGFIELLANILPGGFPFASRVDMWPQTLAIPGFLGGVIFSAVLMIAGGRRRFDELSLPRFAAWGALGGILLGAWGVSGGLPPLIMGFTALGGTIAAATSLTIARMANRREMLEAGAELPVASIAEEQARNRLGG